MSLISQKIPASGPPGCLSMELVLQHIMQAEVLTDKQCGQVEEHIACCQRCANLYRELSEAEADLWEEAVELTGLPQRIGYC